MAPPPALAFENAAPAPALYLDPVAQAVDLVLHALEASHGDRVVLEADRIPMLYVGPRKCALMVGRLDFNSVQDIAQYLFPREFLDALEDVGGIRFDWPGFTAIATYEDGFTIEIKRSHKKAIQTSA